PAGSTPQSTGGIGKGAWVSVGDASLRGQIQDPSSAVNYPALHVARWRDEGDVRGWGASPLHDDNTPYIQQAINESKVVLINEDYKVKKGATDLTHYPDGDQPCLSVIDRDGIEIKGQGSLIVENHGQGCIEVMKTSNAKIMIAIHGPMNFPPIDLNNPSIYEKTGGEKGTGSSGYATSALWGTVKNNSLDTSKRTDGGFSKQFPQYGGGTASTWGTWNGGYIGNTATGILIHNDSHDNTVENCVISGFNYSGVAIGSDAHLDYPVSTGNRIIGNTISECYDNGINDQLSEGTIVHGNKVYDIGHPDAVIGELRIINPGYGITARRVTGIELTSKRLTITDNVFTRCKRKCIDVHTGTDITITGNQAKLSNQWGIFVAYSTATLQQSKGSIIANNTVTDMYGVGITISAINSSNAGWFNVSGNIVRNCSYQYMTVAGDGINIGSNLLIETEHKPAASPYLAMLDLADVKNSVVSGNILLAHAESELAYGILGGKTENTNIYGNQVSMLSTTQTRAGIDFSTGTHNSNVTNNMVNVKRGYGVNLSGVTGETYGNTTPNDIIDVLSASVKNQATVSGNIVVGITFNGTASPSYNILAGEKYVTGVTSNNFGVTISLGNLATTTVFGAMTVRETSSEVVGNTSVSLGRTYDRTLTYNAITIGMQDTNRNNLSAQTCTKGSMRVTVPII
ncbi:right-handed parallel beta-helix repeat-containing protein, partial [Providencia sp. PROV167]|uniref:right-handed parallel beta-helix repeat-containing protein n=1 Tax=Providencia sp. PROV167 TaxID=2949873 RepID=UPI00234BC7A9